MGLSEFLSLLDARHIYDGGNHLAAFVASTITPFLLVISIWLRLAATQLESATSGQGRWGLFFKDLAIWITILGLYFALAHFLTGIFNALYDYFYQRGSLGEILYHFAKVITQVDAGGDTADLLSQSLSILTAPVTFVVWVIYYLSYLVAIFMLTFLKLAHALCFAFALIWGLIAIPLSLTSTFKLLRGWAIFTGISLLWPLIHFGGFALFNPIFEHAASVFVTDSSGGVASLDKAMLYLIMTIVNILATAIAVSAPFITMSLVSNSGSITGVVTPFATAAVGAAAAFAKKAAATGKLTSRAGAAAAVDSASGRNPLTRVVDSIKESVTGDRVNAGQGFRPVAAGPVKASGQTGSVARSAKKIATAESQLNESRETNTAEHETANTENEPEPNRKPKRDQQRRGVIINQNKPKPHADG